MEFYFGVVIAGYSRKSKPFSLGSGGGAAAVGQGNLWGLGVIGVLRILSNITLLLFSFALLPPNTVIFT